MTQRTILRGLALLAAGASLAAAQTPKVREINLYGLRSVSKNKILHAAKFRAGDPLPGSKGDMEEAVGAISGVVGARVEAVCCEGKEVMVFIGIEERGAPHVAFRSEPTGHAVLPDDLADSYQEFAATVQRAFNQGLPDSDTKDFQRQFAAFAADHLKQLREVIRDSAESDQRAIAAAVLGYAPKKQDVLDDLQYAVQDPDEFVRDNALRSLRAIALLSVKQPQLGIRIPPTWFVELLNSLVLSDRMQAADILITLTDGGDRSVLDQIRTRSLHALVEMARWESLQYALPPFLLVGRIAGLKDEETQRRWSAGEREPVIVQALGRPAAKRKPLVH